MAYSDRLKQMNDTELEREYRNRVDANLRYGALGKQYEDCWFAGCDRGLGKRFQEIYAAMREEIIQEQASELKRFREKFGVKA